jgi:glycosyltransferase involved in cell wall biosynthesis
VKISVINSALPEHYPPTLNAISCLAADVEVTEINLLVRDLQFEAWRYPDKVRRLRPGGPLADISLSQGFSTRRKLGDFYRFASFVRDQLRAQRPDLIIVVDYFAVLALALCLPFLKRGVRGAKPYLWYHNHDVFAYKHPEIPNGPRFGSLLWLAIHAERAIFAKFQRFTLPTDDRKRFFKMHKIAASCYALVPNMPAIAFYGAFYQPKRAPIERLNLLFQGAIGPGHGLVEVLQLSAKNRCELPIHLTLKGVVQAPFKAQLVQLADTLGISERLHWQGFTAYQEVPKLAATQDIGIAIHMGTDAMNTTLGRASNKIYEYAAAGLPIILYDSQQFRQYLERYTWAHFTNGTENSLLNCLQAIIRSYVAQSAQAYADFMGELNFEHYFVPVWQQTKAQIGASDAMR